MKKVSVLFVLVLGVLWVSSASAEETYTVQRGDRLERVAAQYGLTQEELLAANPRTAYGVSCGNPRTVELRDGHMRAICGRPRFYLIAGKTLIVPESRLLTQSENVRLNAEVVAFRAEMDELWQERETEKSELDALRQERDNLRNENKTLVAAKAELQGKYGGSQSAFGTVFSRQPKQVEIQRTNYVHIALAIASTAFLAVLAIIVIKYRKGKNEKKFDHLVQFVQPSVLEQAGKNKQRGAELDKQERELATQRGAADELQAQLEKQRGEQEEQGNNLATREETLKQGQEELATAKQAVEGREATCTRREGEIREAERGLLERSEAFRRRVQTEDERLRTDREAVARDKEELLAVRRDLEEKQAEVDATLRTADEDLPGIQRDREEIAEYAQDLVAREADVKRREDEAARRIEEAGRREATATAQIEEADRRKGIADDAEQALVCHREDVEGREVVLKKGEDELTRNKGELEEQLAAAEHTLEVAGGLEKAQNILKRAGRKEAIVEAFDTRERTLGEREAAVAEREGACDTREGALRAWEERRAALGEEGSDDADQTTQLSEPLDSCDATHQDPPAEPMSKCLCGICGKEFPFGELEDHLAEVHGDVDPKKDTEPEPDPVTCGSCDRKFPDRGKFDAHRPECPEAVPHTKTLVGLPVKTGRRASVAGQPACYCNTCHQTFTDDEYARDHAGHDTGLPKPE